MSAAILLDQKNNLAIPEVKLGPPRSTQVATSCGEASRTLLISNCHPDEQKYVDTVNEFYCAFGKIARQTGHKVGEDFELFTLLETTDQELNSLRKNLAAISKYQPRLCVLAPVEQRFDDFTIAPAFRNSFTVEGVVVQSQAFYGQLTSLIGDFDGNIRSWNAKLQAAASTGTEHIHIESIIEFPFRFELEAFRVELDKVAIAFGGVLSISEGVTLT